MTKRINRPDKRFKLKPMEAQLVRSIYRYTETKQTEIAKMFNLAPQTINDIICRRTWKK